MKNKQVYLKQVLAQYLLHSHWTNKKASFQTISLSYQEQVLFRTLDLLRQGNISCLVSFPGKKKEVKTKTFQISKTSFQHRTMTMQIVWINKKTHDPNFRICRFCQCLQNYLDYLFFVSLELTNILITITRQETTLHVSELQKIYDKPLIFWNHPLFPNDGAKGKRESDYPIIFMNLLIVFSLSIYFTFPE